MTHFARLAALLLLTRLLACQSLASQAAPPLDVSQAGGSQISAQGTVLSVERPRPEDTQSFVHLVIAPGDQKPIRLALAPGWYLERQGIRFEPHENVRFEGRTVSHDGEETRVEVRRIEQGDRSYILRDEQNRPAWNVKP